MKVLQFLHSKVLFISLCIIHVILSIGVWLSNTKAIGIDAATYLGLAEGLLHDKYSFWWFLEDYYSDTFRNPGYPLFLAGIRIFSSSILLVQFVQVCLYLGGIYFSVKLLGFWSKGFYLLNIFLIILLPSLYIVVYETMIYPEVPMFFFVTLFLFTDIKTEDQLWHKWVLLALISAVAFQFRPTFLFVPIIYIFYKLIIYKWNRTILFNGFLLSAVYFSSMLPYAAWNFRHHGAFKITSLEGGAGVMHTGVWANKIPGYQEHFYWHNVMLSEIISFIPPEEIPRNIALYEKEWESVCLTCNPYLQAKDSFMLSHAHAGLLPTYNAKYTLCREEELKSFALKHIKSEPFYFLKIKLYATIRLWITGFQPDKIPLGIIKKITFFYPFFVTFITLIVFLFSVIYLFKKKYIPQAYKFHLLMILYVTIIHLPFAIQARYTTPYRSILLFGIALAISNFLNSTSVPKEEAVVNNRT